jgi:hypothetical protein
VDSCKGCIQEFTSYPSLYNYFSPKGRHCSSCGDLAGSGTGREPSRHVGCGVLSAVAAHGHVSTANSILTRKCKERLQPHCNDQCACSMSKVVSICCLVATSNIHPGAGFLSPASQSESKSYYNRRSVGQSVLVSGPHEGPANNIFSLFP